MKRLFTLFAFSLIILSAYSQQDPQFSLNMFNQATVNPGAAGTDDGVCATALIREQWQGFEGNPSTKVFNVNSPLSFMDLPIGAGITIITDNLGFEKNVSLNLAASYQMDIGGGLLSAGFNVGFNNQSLSNTAWLVGDGGSGHTSDPSIPNDESAMGVDLGIGVFYKGDNLYAGFSALHLNEAVLEFDLTSTKTLKRHYYITSGYKIELPDPLFELTPSVFMKYDGSSLQVDINTLLEYNKKIWGGVSYRSQVDHQNFSLDIVSIFQGIQEKENHITY